MIRTGRVVDGNDGLLKVCFNRPEACDHCSGCAGQKHETLVTLKGDAPLGSTVDVQMPAKQVFKASLLAYVVPMVLLFLGLWLGMHLLKSEVIAALLGIGCMGLSYGILRLIEAKLQKKNNWQPYIVAVHEEGETNHGTDDHQE